MIALFSDRLRRRFESPLPGDAAHLQVSHQERKDFFSKYPVPDTASTSSVLILFYSDGSGIRFPLIQRALDGHVHSGQISLPGGRLDPADKDVSETALRETEEEIGVDRSGITLIGRLTDIYIPPSNFMVHPFVGVYQGVPRFRPDPKEVDHVIETDLQELFRPESLRRKQIVLRNGREVDTPAFVYRDYTIWGATAMMLNELRWMLSDHPLIS